MSVPAARGRHSSERLVCEVVVLKYRAESEIGARVFTADTLPEQKVQELQAVMVDVDA